MQLQNFFPALKIKRDIASIDIKGISIDSRLAEKGHIFFVIERKGFDIFTVLKSIDKKISCFVASSETKTKISSCGLQTQVIFVKNIKKAYKKAADIFYGFNEKKFRFIGITGTKGKTTVAFLLYHLLSELKQNVSLVGTIKYIIGNKEYPAINTTPDLLSLRRIFSGLNKYKQSYIIMEVSSHGIVQGRVDGISFSRCIFTNLSHEHLDYHKTMSHYFAAKKGLFVKNKKAIAIINNDDKYAKQLIRGLKKVITYSIGSCADFTAENVVLSKRAAAFELSYKNKKYLVKSLLLGKHNVSNILAAIATTFSLGFPLDGIIQAVSTFKGVEGRLEEVSKDVFVDYAHSPDSLKKALSALRDIGYKKVICLFGCGGNRDKGKRKIMGNIACKFSDFVFITSDNPRNEDPLGICRQIESGFSKKNYKVILDRKEAIGSALRMMDGESGICLLIAGKGHESYQIVGDKKIFLKDSLIVKELVKKC